MRTHLTTVRPLLGVALGVVLTLASGNAQSMTRPQFILGQDARLEVTGAPSKALTLFVFSLNGIGKGSCIPKPIDLCLDLLDPVYFLPVIQADTSGRARLDFIVPTGLALVPVYLQALIGTVSNGQLTATKTNAVASKVETLAALSDEFSGTTLSSRWQLHNSQLVNITVSGGELHLLPTKAGAASTWFADGEGPLLYKLVRGDFTVSAVVRAYLPGSPTKPPPPNYRLGGLMVRDPASTAGRRNWLHVVLGSGKTSIPIAVEDKSTVNSVSFLRLYKIAKPEGEVRITRRGSIIGLWYRPNATSTWTLLRSHTRTDLGPVLQVGTNVMSWTSPVLIRTSTNSVRFQ